MIFNNRLFRLGKLSKQKNEIEQELINRAVTYYANG